jgi:hypothetical protein
MAIKLLTFKTNHTLLCDLDETDDNFVSAKEPVQVVIQPTQQGPMMQFVPFLDFAEEFNTGIRVDRADVLTINTPSTELRNKYVEAFSGIQIVSAGAVR